MVLPIGDDNPRARDPIVSWVFAGLAVIAWASAAADEWPGGGALGFFLSPLLAPDPVTLVWTVLALVVFADNVEDRIGRPAQAALLVGAGWVGATVRAFAVPAPGSTPFGVLYTGEGHAGAAGAATVMAVAYAALFPLHQIRFFHVFAPRRRGLWGMLHDRPAIPDTFHLSAATGILVWGLGMLVGAFAGPRTGGDLAALVVSAAAGLGTGLLFRAKYGAGRLPEEFETPVAPAAPRRAEVREIEAERRYVAPKPLALPDLFEAKGWAVLRETDELFDVGRLGRIVAKATGEMVADATRRIRQTRGVIARGLDEGKARGLAQALVEAGLPAFAVDEVASGGLPHAQATLSCACGAGGLEYELEGGRKVAVNWGDVSVVAAARIDVEDAQVAYVETPDGGYPGGAAGVQVRERLTQTTLVDVVTQRPAARLRVARQEVAHASGADASSAGFRQFAASVMKYRGATPVNKGVSVVAGRGAWGYLAFSSAAAYEEYLWWLLQVIRHRSAPAPAQAGSASATPASWLE